MKTSVPAADRLIRFRKVVMKLSATRLAREICAHNGLVVSQATWSLIENSQQTPSLAFAVMLEEFMRRPDIRAKLKSHKMSPIDPRDWLR